MRSVVAFHEISKLKCGLEFICCRHHHDWNFMKYCAMRVIYEDRTAYSKTVKKAGDFPHYQETNDYYQWSGLTTLAPTGGEIQRGRRTRLMEATWPKSSQSKKRSVKWVSFAHIRDINLPEQLVGDRDAAERATQQQLSQRVVVSLLESKCLSELRQPGCDLSVICALQPPDGERAHTRVREPEKSGTFQILSRHWVCKHISLRIPRKFFAL